MTNSHHQQTHKNKHPVNAKIDWIPGAIFGLCVIRPRRYLTVSVDRPNPTDRVRPKPCTLNPKPCPSPVKGLFEGMAQIESMMGGAQAAGCRGSPVQAFSCGNCKVSCLASEFGFLKA